MITVVTGCMFSGKSLELLSAARRAESAKRYVLCFVPSTDTRGEGQLWTHPGLKREALLVSSDTPWSIFQQVQSARADCAVIDEAQFFGPAIVEVVYNLGVIADVVVATLNKDYTGRPYEVTQGLLGIADRIVPRTAICVTCGDDASYTHRKAASKEKVFVGGAEAYEARCRECFYKVAEEPWVP